MATGVLWAYIFSGAWYKTTYIAAGIAVVVVSIVAATGGSRFDGIVRATLPVVAYFALLLLTAAWAAYPRETVRWVLIDSVYGAVFVLFFLARRNSDGRAVAWAMLSLAIPATAVTIVDVMASPGR